MLSIVTELGVDSGVGLLLANFGAAFGAGLWRLLLIPLDTCKTVLQVDGLQGFNRLVHRVRLGQVGGLYAGAYASGLATMVGHYPWFTTFNFLNKAVQVPAGVFAKLSRSAFIGLCSSLVSDVCTNWIRVVKTLKQTQASADTNSQAKPLLTYAQVVRSLLSTGSMQSFLFRGLKTRVIANGAQSIVFTVCWRYLQDLNKQSSTSAPPPAAPPAGGAAAASAVAAASPDTISAAPDQKYAGSGVHGEENGVENDEDNDGSGTGLERALSTPAADATAESESVDNSQLERQN